MPGGGALGPRGSQRTAATARRGEEGEGEGGGAPSPGARHVSHTPAACSFPGENARSWVVADFWLCPHITKDEYSSEGLMWKLKLQYFGHLIRRAIGKDPDGGKEKGATEDDMVG